MTERKYNDWKYEACDTCNRIAQEFDFFEDEDELPTKWLCVGRIIKPEKPKDLHEKHNEIRCCLWDTTKKNNKASFDWTPFEALTTATALNFVVGDYLMGFQPEKGDN